MVASKTIFVWTFYYIILIINIIYIIIFITLYFNLSI